MIIRILDKQGITVLTTDSEKLARRFMSDNQNYDYSMKRCAR